MAFDLVLSPAFTTGYPSAPVGALVMDDVANPPQHPLLDDRKAAVESELRSRFAGGDPAAIRRLPTIHAYGAYFKRFKKTYHVQLQIESVAFKERPIPSVAALVEAMFAAELKNAVLTAGHDLDKISGQVRVEIADGSESYKMLNGQEQALKQGDMFMADDEGVISSVLYGPDRRTAIGPDTGRVLFTAYGVPGVERAALQKHLEDIRDNVLLIAPKARVMTLAVSGGQR